MNINKETLDFIKEHLHCDIKELALKAKKKSDVDVLFALQQISGKQSAKTKLPSWFVCDNLLYPKSLSMEQCSSEPTANYKASLVRGKTMVDLTGGFGIDCYFIAKSFEQATYVERQSDLSDLVKYNYGWLKADNIIVYSE